MPSKYSFALRLLTVLVVLFIVSLLYQFSPALHLDGRETECGTEILKSKSDVTAEEWDESVPCPNMENPYHDAKGWKVFISALKRYKKFHKEKIERLKSAQRNESVRTLTWACSQTRCSGLGDQLLRLQFFFLLAMMSDRVFTIYWDEGLQKSTKYLRHNEIDWSFFDKNLGMCTDEKTTGCSRTTYDCTSMWGFSWTINEFQKFGNALFGSEPSITVTGQVSVNTMFIDDELILDPGHLISTGLKKLGIKDILAEGRENSVYYRSASTGFWYSVMHTLGIHHLTEIPEINRGSSLITGPWLYLSHAIFCYLFKFPQKLISNVDKLQKSLDIEDRQYMGVHLRTAFKGTPSEEDFFTRWHLKNTKMFEDEKAWACILDHAVELSNSVMGPNSVIYLAADSTLAKEWALQRYGRKIRTANMTLIHSAHGRSQSKCQDSNTAMDGYLSLWLDLFLLSRASFMVHGDSSFGIIAGFLYPTDHLRHCWIVHDSDVGCIVSNIAGNVTCIC